MTVTTTDPPTTDLDKMREKARTGESISWIHDGTYTIESPKGGHRTFDIRTQKLDKDFAPGKRIVSLLVGTDNESDYKGFGFVREDGITAWRKLQSKDDCTPSDFEWFADIITSLIGEKPSRYGLDYAAAGYTYQESTRCCACARKLTDPESIRIGMGPTCRELT